MTPQRRHSKKGFTLLEVILAISILAIMISVIFSVTTSSVQLSKNIVHIQSHSRHQAAFNSYIKQLLANLPSDTQITLEENELKYQTLTIENPNTEFPAQGRQHLAKQLWLAIGTDINGLANLSLEASNQIEDEASDRDPIYFQTELINSLSSIRWEFYQASRDEWSTEWTPSMGRPSMVKFFYSHPDIEEEYMHYFWVPNRKQPTLNVNTRKASP